MYNEIKVLNHISIGQLAAE